MSIPAGSQELADATTLQPVDDLLVDVTFDGLIEAAVLDRDRFDHALSELVREHPPGFEASFEARHCSLLVDDQTHPGADFTVAKWQRFNERLAAVVACFDPHEEIASTLRCTERFADRVQETVYLCTTAGIRRVSRTRPVAARERARVRADGQDHNGAGPRRRSAVVLLTLFLLLGALLVWHEGLLYRLHPTASDALHVDTGACGTLIATTITASWGSYHVVLHRGPTYPTTPAALTQQLAAAASLNDRAMLNAIANGSDIALVLEDVKGGPLAATMISMRPLLDATDGSVSADLPGDVRADRLLVALEIPPPSTR